MSFPSACELSPIATPLMPAVVLASELVPIAMELLLSASACCPIATEFAPVAEATAPAPQIAGSLVVFPFASLQAAATGSAKALLINALLINIVISVNRKKNFI